ncbi:MAG: electron transfer flavoprotein subunit alpha/FixB family protein [Chloroflexi bacterium]|nr:electron transfer flavoprotein subunit alpha/FixB family protein [Chloroflexota bacterium]
MILGLIEHDRGKLNDLSLEMLTFGRRLANQLGSTLEAVLIGEAARPLAERLQAYGVSTVYLVQHDRLDDYAPEAWAGSLVEVMMAAKPQIVIAPGSDRGNEVMAHVAARSNLPMAANCTGALPGDPFIVTRVRWGGSLLEEARLGGEVKLLTVSPHALVAEEAPAAELTINTITPSLADKDFRVRVTGRVEAGEGKISLAEAKVVVGGGRGVGSAEGFKKLEELAGLLGAAVGCSRAVTSLGWRPHADQIGQTGTRIAPEIYIACGVSGATQHLVGCQGAKRILAINTDPEATIIAKANYAIIGDLHEVLPALSEEVRKVRK